ncbi:cysteine proteinase [Macroventuria anomochaeta]|uniref:Cysteine proteinase n=1 Tax=Macroventuria anomochaeta TaxID=301207 RepID=A0ACB6S7Z8_9PLEO|nr:cysteine proteinase [Macroventuria anomochaeta]KAF2630088.1 cysteine proteinase [Macroventuria anomochaeta]
MAVDPAPASASKMDSSPNRKLGITVSPDEASSLPATNGSASVEAGPDDQHINNDAVGHALTAERSCGISAKTRKRDSAEPCGQPGPKRVKSPTSTQNGSIEPLPQDPNEPVQPVASFNKETWQGFCEIESEPAYFSAILRDMGVQGINVREVVAMQPWFLETIPRPTYGLILLYRYRDHGSSDQPTESSNHVWFANQLPAQNSCATLAMINILMNNTDIEIGDHLQQFKDFTKDFTPYQRGEALACFDFIKKIHNSFAKKMDILEADKHLSYKAKKAQRLLNDKKARRESTDSAATDESAEGYEDNAHHFIAYVPVGHEIWMLDGLNARPMSVGTFDTSRGEDWLSTAADSILAILAGGGDDYTGFAIIQSPLLSLRKQACLAINCIKCTELRLDEISPDWRSFTINDSSPPHPQMLGIEDQLSAHPVPDTLAATIAGEEMRDLLKRRTIMLKDLDHLATNIVSEMQNEAEEAQKAAQGRFDCGPVIKLWAEMLAGNGYLEQNLDRFIGSKGRDKKAKK